MLNDLPDQDNPEKNKAQSFCIVEFEEKRSKENAYKYSRYFTELIGQYFTCKSDVNVHLVIIYGPNITSATTGIIRFNNFILKPLEIYIIQADTDDLFEKFDKMLNTKGESKATPMDILKLIAIIRLGVTDINLIKKCFEYINKPEIIENSFKNCFLKGFDNLVYLKLTDEQRLELQEDPNMVGIFEEVRQKALQEAFLKHQEALQEYQKNVAKKLLKQGNSYSEIIDTLGVTKEWLETFEKKLQ
jgi:hypothetical protein